MFKSYKTEVLSELQSKIAVGLEVIGGMAESFARDACPVDTGRLQNSITHSQAGEQTEVIGTNVEYGPYVELGTWKMSARPFLRTAAENHADLYRSVMQKAISE